MKTVKKGDIGESIIRRELEAKGLIIYECGQNKGHVVDFYCQYKGKSLFGVEVKTYPRQYAYTRTGIDRADYDTYLELYEQQKIDVVLFFVDEFEQSIYNQKVSVLNNFSTTEGEKVYFPLGSLKHLRKLTARELEQVKIHSNVDLTLYSSTERFFNKRKEVYPT